jgi:hypothetical protein
MVAGHQLDAKRGRTQLRGHQVVSWNGWLVTNWTVQSCASRSGRAEVGEINIKAWQCGVCLYCWAAKQRPRRCANRKCRDRNWSHNQSAPPALRLEPGGVLIKAWRCDICDHTWRRVKKPMKCPNPECRSTKWDDGKAIKTTLLKFRGGVKMMG